MKYSFIVYSLFILSSCSTTKLLVNENQAIDYSNGDHWAALPSKQDPSDQDPQGKKPLEDGGIDIFFLYPTSLLARKDRSLANAPIDYKKVNKITDQSSIKYQASIFNQVGRVYAPRYRQAHIHNYYSLDQDVAKKTFELAYKDVKDAFDYYLQHFNQGRPIIIAGHSQGTTHGMRLVKEYFDGKPLQEKLIVAYLPGMPIPVNFYSGIRICNTPDDLSCVNSWRTYKYGYKPKFLASEKPMITVNPLTWTRDTAYTDKSNHKGAVLKKFNDGILPQRIDAKINDNILWVHKPRFPGSFLFFSNNFHIADFNFFYLDIRENAAHRRDLYLKTR